MACTLRRARRPSDRCLQCSSPQTVLLGVALYIYMRVCLQMQSPELMLLLLRSGPTYVCMSSNNHVGVCSHIHTNQSSSPSPRTTQHNTNRFAKALAVMMFIIFCSYGLGMWYGASEVARDLRRGCVGVDCKTGGDVLTVFWAILNGAMVRESKAKPRNHCCGVTTVEPLSARRGFIGYLCVPQ